MSQTPSTHVVALIRSGRWLSFAELQEKATPLNLHRMVSSENYGCCSRTAQSFHHSPHVKVNERIFHAKRRRMQYYVILVDVVGYCYAKLASRQAVNQDPVARASQHSTASDCAGAVSGHKLCTHEVMAGFFTENDGASFHPNYNKGNDLGGPLPSCRVNTAIGIMGTHSNLH